MAIAAPEIGRSAWADARRRYALWAALAVLAVVGAAFAFVAARAFFAESERDRAEARAAIFRGAVSAEVERLSHLPAILAADPLVIATAAGVAPDRLNRKLAAHADGAEVEAIYLMARTGVTIAASNFGASQTFVGQNYGFRPYFAEAMEGRESDFFAVGATTSRPGFFLAAPVRGPAGDVSGVLAIKIDLDGFTADWAAAEETVFVTNRDGVVILASDPALLYSALAPLPAERLAEIAAARQFGDRPLDPLDWEPGAEGRAELAGSARLHVAVDIGDVGWTLHLMADEERARERAWFALALAAAALTLVAASGLAFRGERFRAALRVSQEDRAALRAGKERLEREIEERQAAEARAAEAESELRRAGKMAALGQLAASVTHELGQPLSAMRNYLAAAEIGGAAPTEKISSLVDRMEGITRQLRFFAQPGERPMEEVDLFSVAEAAAEMVAPDAARLNARIETTPPDAPVIVRGVGPRLEQVAVNLIRNAVQAAAETGGGVRVFIETDRAGAMAALVVEDDGPGLLGAEMETLQEPFATTRASGEGMGLGLAISAEIVREHDGRLSAEERPGGGARFSVSLKRVKTT
ncbi:MAG: ATP-binding protein [Pseudomonadota bacterium]